MRVHGWIVCLVAACGGGGDKASETTPSNTAAPAPATPAPESDQARQDREAFERAEAEAAQARKEASEAREQVEAMMVELDAFAKRLDEAVTAVTEAQNDADRRAASEKLKVLQKEHAELKQRAAQARAAAEKAERKKGIKHSKECQDNPLAKNCI